MIFWKERNNNLLHNFISRTKNIFNININYYELFFLMWCEGSDSGIMHFPPSIRDVISTTGVSDVE